MAEKTENQEQKKSGVVKISSGGSADKFWHPRFWDGMTFCAWIKLLNSARWRVAPFRLPMAFIVTCLAFNGSFWAFWQKVLYGRKIRDAQMQKVPYMLVIGDKEKESRTVGVRERSKGDLGSMSLEGFKELLSKEFNPIH